MNRILILFLASLGIAAAQDDAKAKLMEAGQKAFPTCMACHGQDGKGLPIGDKKMAPSLAGSKIANGKPEILAAVILKGIAKETQDYMGIMAPLEAAFASDEQLAGIMTYIRNSFGNEASVVTPEEAKAFRTQWAEQKQPMTRAKIEELEK
ncbi:mono/diheme cytochrome c family protein [Haloferula luteola]|uniref:Mono/diheme cytochrome c family protein n=1 Tax=Haloferula luteola TaxID=595692 RepID=A0A840UYP9_9BACT|nr:cytochrome c [Haloferula luteola]MBB5350133.1 mono/diheme cytochrome c family protein [Haloferula luteola]